MERQRFWRSPHPGARALRGSLYLLALTAILFAPIVLVVGSWTLIPMSIGIFTGIGALAWLFMAAPGIYDYLNSTRVAGRIVGTIPMTAGAALCIYVVPEILAVKPGSHRRQGSATAAIVVVSTGLFAGGAGLMLGWRRKRGELDGR